MKGTLKALFIYDVTINSIGFPKNNNIAPKTWNRTATGFF